MPIQSLLQRPVHKLPPDAPCAEAARLMRDENIGAVAVADGTRPRGLVTDRDLALRVVAEGEDSGKILLREVMSGEPIFLEGSRSLQGVIEAMRELEVRRILIVDKHGDLLGLVSMDDLLILLSGQLAQLGETIHAEIRAPA